MDMNYSELNVITISSGKLQTAEKVDLELISRGTFAGTIYGFGLVDNGRPAAADTGDQGGGQN
jgi:hypothetical protein